MEIEWNICNDKIVNILLKYNLYLRTKKLYVNGEKILEQKGRDSKDRIEFPIGDKKYILELEPEDYEYTGYIITPSGERVPSKKESIVKKKTPLWIIPFAVFIMMIPIISVETLTTWIIGILFSYMTAVVARQHSISNMKKAAFCAIISCIAWLVYFIYYLMIKNNGFWGGFIPFHF